MAPLELTRSSSVMRRAQTVRRLPGGLHSEARRLAQVGDVPGLVAVRVAAVGGEADLADLPAALDPAGRLPACRSSSQACCSAAVALLRSQRSPLSSARHCRASAWAIRFRAAASMGLPPQSASCTERTVGGLGAPAVPGSGRAASGCTVFDGMGLSPVLKGTAATGLRLPVVLFLIITAPALSRDRFPFRVGAGRRASGLAQSHVSARRQAGC